MRFLTMAAFAVMIAGCGGPQDRLSDEEASAEQSPPVNEEVPADTAEEPEGAALPEPGAAGPEIYKAVGNEPGWSLTVREARMDYLGDYGEVRISERTPAGFRPANGTYASGRLRFTISPGPCSDGMSDLVYRQTVRLTADGKTVDGCGGGTIAPASLAGTSWTVIAVNGRPTPGGASYFLSFTDDAISARFGCNSIGGSYRQNGDHLSTNDLAQTLMGCPEPAATIEQRGSAVLRSNMRIERISGTRIRLVSEAGTIDLRRAI